MGFKEALLIPKGQNFIFKEKKKSGKITAKSSQPRQATEVKDSQNSRQTTEPPTGGKESFLGDASEGWKTLIAEQPYLRERRSFT